MKRQATDQEKIFADHISNKRLVSGIHKELSKPNNRKYPLKKKCKRFEQRLHQGRYIMGNKYMKRGLTWSLVLREMQINEMLLHTY